MSGGAGGWLIIGLCVIGVVALVTSCIVLAIFCHRRRQLKKLPPPDYAGGNNVVVANGALVGPWADEAKRPARGAYSLQDRREASDTAVFQNSHFRERDAKAVSGQFPPGEGVLLNVHALKQQAMPQQAKQRSRHASTAVAYRAHAKERSAASLAGDDGVPDEVVINKYVLESAR